MRTKNANQRARRIVSYVMATCAAVVVTLYAAGRIKAQVQAPTPNELTAKAFQPSEGIIAGRSYHNDTSPPLRDMRQVPIDQVEREEHEANPNPKLPHQNKGDVFDPVVQLQQIIAPDMPAPILNFDGIPFPGVACNCAPPDTNGEVGATQYVQIVNEGYQVFSKSTGASILGPSSIVSLWAGFGGVCQNNGNGDPVVLYDQLAGRWVITQFAGTSVPTDECIAVSTTSDATGSWNRYGFHLGTNFFDYPHLGVWPDAYYMSMNVFNASGSAFLGPQAFAFDRAAMLAGTPASFVSPGITGGPSEDSFLPADLDGLNLPPSGAPGTFVEAPFTGAYRVFHFHADFAVPANSTFTLFASPPAAPFAELCPTTRACVPEPGGNFLDGIGDRLMFRLAYRNFGDHESVVGNMTVRSGGVAAPRWFELRNVSAGPTTVYQESTYQPDTDWRWMGSAAMDHNGDIAVGYSASSAAIFPQIRYAGRLVTDPLNVLSQGEAHLFDGTGAQLGTANRWGDYSDLTIDPVDDCTFWYTTEYYSTTSSFNWRTRIGSFKFPSCVSTPVPLVMAAATTLTNECCTPRNGAIDPGERVTLTFNVQNVGSGSTSNLVGTLLNTGGVTLASGSQTYGAIAPGATVGRPFRFKASGTCGGTITATIHLQDGSTDLGNATYTLRLGVQNTITTLAESFDGVIAPALPAGWTTAATGVESPWVTSTTNPSSAPNDAFVPDPSNIGNTELVTPTIAVPAGGAKVTFRNLYNMESTFDGTVLEISINGAAFTDITTGGNAFLTGGYGSTISVNFGSPIAGRQAWSGLSGGSSAAPTYITSSINLPAAANGKDVKLKWRAATDNSVSAPGAAGVRIDGITLDTVTFRCSTLCAVPTGDFDGDAKADFTVFRASTGGWHVLNSSTNYTTSQSFSWGLSTDTPAPGDYDGDGKIDPAIYRASAGLWAVLKSSTNYTTSFVVSWGLGIDVPVQADFDGDGKTDPAIFRPSTGLWAVLNSNTNYTTSFTVSWGLSIDQPMQGDYDGDGKADPAIFRASTGQWAVLNSSTHYTTSFVVLWGLSTDIPVPGDYDGDSKVDPAVYRQSTGGWYILNSNTNYTTSFGVSWGLSTDVPAPADYDGDGKFDPAIFRPSTGLWAVLNSSTNFTTSMVISWGLGTDTPMNKRP